MSTTTPSTWREAQCAHAATGGELVREDVGRRVFEGLLVPSLPSCRQQDFADCTRSNKQVGVHFGWCVIFVLMALLLLLLLLWSHCRSGGIQGGISNGEDIVLRVAFKPTSTIGIKQQTVTRAGEGW